jgi:malic enzyme
VFKVFRALRALKVLLEQKDNKQEFHLNLALVQVIVILVVENLDTIIPTFSGKLLEFISMIKL